MLKKKLDVHCVSPLDKAISKMKAQIQKDIGSNTDYPKIILIGNTGSGKSSLSCALANLGLIVSVGVGHKLILNGKGVLAGGTSVTKQPQLLINHNNKKILCDCPGFCDTFGTLQEIKNSFIIDYLFQSDPSKENCFKVLLVASACEIAASRGQIIADSINRAAEMLQDPSQIEQGLGLVITKAEQDRNAQDYLEELQENPTNEMIRWCQFFSDHIDQVFVMPIPSRSEIGKQYSFDDKERLLNFLNSNYMINPIHKITLSESARSQMENLQMMHVQAVSDIIRDVFEKISIKFKNEDQSINLERWLAMMNTMINKRINNTITLKEFINENIPNEGEFNIFFDQLKHYENFDSFINKALNTPCISTSIHKAISTCLYNVIDELKTLIKYSKRIEEQIMEIDENDRRMEEIQEQSRMQSKMLEEQRKYIQEKKEERKKILEQLDEMQAKLIETNKQLAQIERDKKRKGIIGAIANLGIGIVESLITKNPIPAITGVIGAVLC